MAVSEFRMPASGSAAPICSTEHQRLRTDGGDRTVGTEHMMVAMLGARLMVCPFGQAVADSSDKGFVHPFAPGAPKAAKRLEIPCWYFCTFRPSPVHSRSGQNAR
jgi:hypothetical protein